MGNSIVKKWTALEKQYKIAFIGTFVIGLLTHMYMITNKFPNHDYPYNVYNDQFRWPLMLGRWFLKPATAISSYFILPWVIGVLAIAYVAAAAVFVVGILRLKNTVPVLLCGGLLITYPAFTDSMGFLFTTDGYMLALLLASAAVWVWEYGKGIKSHLLFMVLLGVATGIYQSYLSFAIYLILIRLILDILEKRYDNRTLLVKIGRALLGGVLSLVFYYGMQMLVMKLAGVTFADYMGISSAGLLSLGTILTTLGKDTIGFAELFIGSNGEFTAYEILNMVFIVCFLAMYVYTAVKTKLYQNRLQSVLFVVANLLLIPSAFLWDFISEDVIYRLMMLYCVALIYILGVVIADRFLAERAANGYALLMVVIIFNFHLIDNIGYYNLNLCWEQSYATAIQMQDRLQQLDGYEMTEDVLIIGTLQMKNQNRREWVTDRIPPMIGVEDVNLMRNQDFIVSILNNDLGMVLSGVRGEQEVLLRQSEEVQQMGCWPSADSVRMVDDVMVIKLQELEE